MEHANMSSDKTIKATVNGETLPENATLSTPFKQDVAIGDVYYQDGKRYRVTGKDWFLDSDGNVSNIGLVTEDA